jgi:hypothetical protein
MIGLCYEVAGDNIAMANLASCMHRDPTSHSNWRHVTSLFKREAEKKT